MAVVIAGWAPSHPPMMLLRGDTVQVGDRDEEWPEYVWCTGPKGGGWVPDAVLSIGDDGSAVAARDYSTAELAVEPGAEVTVVERLASWSWCRDARGRLGWVPDKVLGG